MANNSTHLDLYSERCRNREKVRKLVRCDFSAVRGIAVKGKGVELSELIRNLEIEAKQVLSPEAFLIGLIP
jgi:hypothetical protein